MPAPAPIQRLAVLFFIPFLLTGCAKTVLVGAPRDEDRWYEWRNLVEEIETAPEGERETKLAFLVDAAERGVAPAQYVLSNLHRYGEGVEQDQEKSLLWLRKAAENENEHAITTLGCRYFEGDGVPLDDSKAAHWLEKAAAMGDERSMATLYFMHRSGFGIPRNPDKAKAHLENLISSIRRQSDRYGPLPDYGVAKVFSWSECSVRLTQDAALWFQKGADKKHPTSIRKLADAHLKGMGVLKDEKRAAALYRKAAELGDFESMSILAEMLESGDLVERSLERAFHWRRKAAESLESDTMAALALMHLKGLGTKPDGRAAARLLEKTVKMNDYHVVNATLLLGQMLSLGQGVEKDEARGRALLEKAESKMGQPIPKRIEIHETSLKGQPPIPKDLPTLVKQAASGDPAAQRRLWYVSNDHFSAYSNTEWLEKSAAAGDAFAVHLLARLYRDGDNGYPKDPAKALGMFEMAAGKGIDVSHYVLGDMYADGIGVKRDDAKAVEWFVKGAEFNEYFSKTNLIEIHLEGLGGPKNDALAARWLFRGADAGDPKSMVMLARMHLEGRHVATDRARAKHLLTKAAVEKKNAEAEAILKKHFGGR